jgi:hypothetical protein
VDLLLLLIKKEEEEEAAIASGVCKSVCGYNQF